MNECSTSDTLDQIADNFKEFRIFVELSFDTLTLGKETVQSILLDEHLSQFVEGVSQFISTICELIQRRTNKYGFNRIQIRKSANC